MTALQEVLEDITEWASAQGWQILRSGVDSDGDGILVFSPKEGFFLHLVLVPEKSGLFFYHFRTVLNGQPFAWISLDNLACRISSRVKAVICYPDEDGDLVFAVEGFTHDPHALPCVIPRIVQVLDHASDLAMGAALFHGAGPGRRGHQA